MISAQTWIIFNGSVGLDTFNSGFQDFNAAVLLWKWLSKTTKCSFRTSLLERSDKDFSKLHSFPLWKYFLDCRCFPFPSKWIYLFRVLQRSSCWISVILSCKYNIYSTFFFFFLWSHLEEFYIQTSSRILWSWSFIFKVTFPVLSRIRFGQTKLHSETLSWNKNTAGCFLRDLHWNAPHFIFLA